MFDMTQEILTSGDHYNVVRDNQPELKTGKFYTLTIQGIDFAGNVGNSETIQGIQIVNPHE